MDKRIEYLAPVIPFSPFVIDKAYGNYVTDKNGNRLLDVNSGQFCAILGHSNPELSQAINENSARCQHSCTSLLSESVLAVAKKINQISGPLDARILLLSTGSEAVETCLRYGKHISGKNGVICFENGYHGLSYGSQSVTFAGIYAKPNVQGIFSIPAPRADDTTVAKKALHDLERILEDHGEEIGIIILEPIVSVGGLIYPSAAFFKRVRELSIKYDVLLAFDESQTGFGRTGYWFAYQMLNVIPDFVICSKAIGLGYPVAALLFSGSMIKSHAITMTHYSSHQNDPFAADIVMFGIEYMEKHDLLCEVRKKGAYFLSKLKQLENECLYFGNARGVGLMLGLDLQVPGIKNYRPISKQFHEIVLKNGMLIQSTDGGRVLRFLPGYLINKEEIDCCAEVLKQSYFELFNSV